MNNLSWFLYFADIIPTLAGYLLGASIGIFIVWSLRAFIVGAEDYPFQGVTTGRTDPKYSWMVIAIALMLLSALIPSKDTIYLIAGSEAGEAVVTSESGKEILNDIQQVIKHQLGELKGKAD